MLRLFTLTLLVAGAIAVSVWAAAGGGSIKPAFESPLVSTSTPGQATAIEVNLEGAKELYLVVTDGGDGFGCDWADWCEPRIVTDSGEVKLTELKWKSASAEFGEAMVNKNAQGRALIVNDKPVSYGIGTHANSVIAYDLPKSAKKFLARGGLDRDGVAQGCGSTVKFVVFTQRPPEEFVAAKKAAGAAADPAQHDPAAAVGQLDVAEGLVAQLFASEPAITSITNIDVDHRGRVWACDVVNYRGNNGKRAEGDRIMILEDADGDGKAEKSKVFFQGHEVDTAMGICVLGNKCIVSATPNIWVFTFDENDKIVKKDLLFTKTGQPQHDHSAHTFSFGPDGRLYWNFGNTGQAVHDKNGKLVVDLAGNEVKESGKPYWGGMPFRCNMEGGEFEVLAHNFRNNYEVAVDSFGTIWQSDNDDDGNKGVRINYVMEYGNYGYRDEITGAGWNSPRTNLESEIPLRHWHLNDPGVVPNLLQTGAGSPCGITVYEGRLLPKPFWDQVIHCDAGPNVCRAYPVTKSGAGYKAEIVNVLYGARNNWFRPVDPRVAPDGSLIVSDWYDPGVGGHGQRDIDRGRIFRVAPSGSKYVSPKLDVSTPEGATAALASPNSATRYLAYTALAEMKDKGEAALVKMFGSENPRLRARALWLLARLEGKGSGHLQKALSDSDSDLRITALRAARSLKMDVIPIVSKLVKDESPQVRRECAIALRHHASPEAASLWAELAAQHDAQDRWYLEALGIGADKQWDAYLAAYLKKVGNSAASPAVRDVIWRSRAAATPGLLAKALLDPALPEKEVLRFLRAFDFQADSDARQDALLSVAFSSQADAARQSLLTAECSQRLKGFDANKNPQHKAALNRALGSMKGTAAYVLLVDKFQLAEHYPELLSLAKREPESEVNVAAAKVLLARGQSDALRGGLADKNPQAASALARALAAAADAKAEALLLGAMDNTSQVHEVRAAAVRGVAQFKTGATELLKRAKQGSLDPALKEAVAFSLHTSPFGDLKEQAIKLFPLPPAKEGQALPAIDELVKRKGNGENGKKVFATTGTCAKCHKAQGVGLDIGPELSGIGAKLGRPALFESVVFPSASIAHSYETTSLTLASGVVVQGIVTSETADSVTIKVVEGPPRTFKTSEIERRIKQPISLMPADLSKTISVEELVDVVEYLTTLRQTK